VLFVCIAGLIGCGLALLALVIRLLRPVLEEAVPTPSKERRRWLEPPARRITLVIAGVSAVVLVVAAGVLGGTASVERAKHSAAAASAIATTAATTAAEITTSFASTSATTGADFQPEAGGKWLAGDMHTHTFLTGGQNSQSEVAHQAFDTYGLDWLANSEHGGVGDWDQFGNTVPKTPRWWSLLNWSWPLVRDLRTQFPGKQFIQGVEWNLPRGGDASVGFASDDANAVAEFDYRFDAMSASNTFPGSPPKDNKTTAGSVNAVTWLQANHADDSYLVLNHPSRGLTYRPGDVRDYIAAAPGVTAGFEGMPGHQKQTNRGGYGSVNPLGRNYQGADPWLAHVGGFWDSLLANGSRFHVFANSDFHGTSDDFWPGEYAKNWTFVTQPENMDSLVAGLKSGRSFSAFGDLVDGLKFSAQGDGKVVGMGRDALVVHRGSDVVVTVKFHTPPSNNHGDSPSVDHLDVIAGDVTGPAVKGEASWEASTNPSARVVRTFTRPELQDLGVGWYGATLLVSDVQGPMYLRLRATNLPPNTPHMTDALGNPLIDAVAGNGADRAWSSLWFYSNPIWIDVRR
jgi:hypothetical protein